MAKKVYIHPAERLDLNDAGYILGDTVHNLRGESIRAMVGAGVLDGFRIRVPEQVGSDIGAIEIYNGVATDWGGDFINAETGTTSERLVLAQSSTEFWVEIELLWVDSDTDLRAFWDANIDQTSPQPDGAEVDVSRVFTRKTLSWRVKQPIRNNLTGIRTSGAYDPVHFSPSDDSCVPIAVIRTNSSGLIISGVADSSPDGNDLISYDTAEGSNRRFVKVRGYGDPTRTDAGGNNWVFGYKTTDQRARMFEPLIPPFMYGVSGEVIGDSRHDGWIRDAKSAYDHLAGQISEIKNGAGVGNIGVYHNCTITAIADDFTYVDLSSIEDNGTPVAEVISNPDQFIGATFQVTDSNWAGFYARILGNDRRGKHVAGQTRIYLERNSHLPDWMEFPDTSVGISAVIVQSRQNNWLSRVTPSSSYRGLNALDEEVVNGRTDWWSNQVFSLIGSRLNANKLPTLTIAPPDSAGVDSTTGEPVTSTHPRADVFSSVTNIRNAFSTMVSEQRGGLVHFRAGTYDFNTVPAGTSVFSVSGSGGYVFQGSGREETVLKHDTSVSAIFECSGVKDLVFKDMTIWAKGTPLIFGSCSNVYFENCWIIADYDAIDTNSVTLGSADGFRFYNCIFQISGAGIDADSFTDSEIRHCRIVDVNQDPNKTLYVMNLGGVTRSRIHDTFFQGYPLSSVFESSVFDNSEFHHVQIEANSKSGTVSGTSYSSQIISFGSVTNSHVDHVVHSQLSNDTDTNYGINFGNITSSTVDHLYFENCVRPLSCGVVTGCTFDELIVNVLGAGAGLTAGNITFSCFENVYVTAKGSSVTGVNLTGDIVQCSMSNLNFSVDGGSYTVAVTSSGAVRMMTIDNADIIDAATGITFTGSLAQVLLESNKLNGNAIAISTGITINNSSVYGLYIKNNRCNGASTFIDINNIANAVMIMVDDNTCYDLANGVLCKLSTSANHISFSGNSFYSATNLGISLDVSGTSIRRMKMDGNTIDADNRAFEIYSSGGGVIYESSFAGNETVSNSYTPLVIGVAGSGAVPSIPAVPMKLVNCSVFKNTSRCTSLISSGFWLTELDKCDVVLNKVRGRADGKGIFIAGPVTRSKIFLNSVFIDAGDTGAYGLYFDDAVTYSSICGNDVDTYGAFSGIIFNSTHEYLIINHNFIDGEATAGCNGIDATALEKSIINSNLLINVDDGIDLDAAQDNMVSGNHTINALAAYINLGAGSANNRGGAVASPGAAPPQWPNDAGTNSVQNYNIGT